MFLLETDDRISEQISLLLSYSLLVVERMIIRIPLIGDGSCDGRSTIDGRELMIVEMTSSGLSASSEEIVTGRSGFDGVKNCTANLSTLLVGLTVMLPSESTPAGLKVMVIW